jgi:uncharacterized protein (TIGR01777 family)
MTILVTGAGGLIGSALVPALRDAAHSVLRATRGPAGAPDQVSWEPASGRLGPGAFEGIVHLAGESLASGRWTAARRERLRTSRVDATRALVAELAARPPRVMVCASAVGFYGDRGDEALDESSAPGVGFLSGLVQDWERASEPLAAAGSRIVHLRLGLVLAAEGGTLAAMRLPFRLGLGGRLGDGRQFWSWIAHDDAISAFRLAVEDDTLRGPVNLVSPAPVRQAEFARALGRAMGRPAVLAAPAFALRLVLGAMVDSLVLPSARVLPTRLEALGFAFRHPTLEPALRDVLARG